MTDILFKDIERVSSKKGPVIRRARKALQVLQVSARDQNVLVASPGIMPKKDKALENPKILLRRSKRNAEKQENCPSKEEPSNSKISKASKSTKRVLQSKKNVKKPKNKGLILPKQSSLDSYISTGSKSQELSTIVSKSSKTYIAAVPKLPEKNTATISSESNLFENTKTDTFIVGKPAICITSKASDATFNVPTDWKKVAEERRKDLEVLIRENAELKEEFDVLEADNEQMKSLLQEAERVAEIVKAALV